MPAGYSGTPLAKKLGMKAGARVLLVGAPAGIEGELEGLPEGVALTRSGRANGPFDVIVFFTASRGALEASLDGLRGKMTPACGLWIAWPKKASGVKSDITEDVVREVTLAAGLVDNKVCAIDATWSGLRVVIRVRDRG
ncbi:MAG: DUF3052 domain-containing protein [Phycisphaerae bacterium]|nr:DUF3052 domain-containing protein [Phycisphaerae bacterium]